ncbi:MAG: hypothetical protein FWF77_01690 [Defluviitaleaceae bacterium]|nr:hypothetical protein [Defluviitaleaceae bacterium]
MSNMVVRTNVYSLNAHRNMKNVGLEQRRASNRLSSGFRINSAADDAAGLAISENMRAQIRGLDQASRNAQDGQAMLLTTEGGLDEIGNMLIRVRELMVQASNDTNTQAQRVMIEQEIAQLGEEILSMQRRVEFNTNQVLNIGDHGSIRIALAENRMLFAEAQVELAEATVVHANLVAEARVEHAEAMDAALIAYAEAVQLASEMFQDEVRQLGEVPPAATNYLLEALLAARDAAFAQARAERAAAVAEADMALYESLADARTELMEARAEFTTAMHVFTTTIRSQFHIVSEDTLDGIGVAWFQVGANSLQGISFDFTTASQAVLVAGNLVNGIADALVMTGSSRESGIGFGVNMTSLINAVGDGIEAINSVRANLGAVQNRMDFTMRSLDISSENLQDSESRVRNADIAREMMRFTMTNVLQQAAVSMLAQANQIPQNLLQLLR